jgi:hypothetical protein
MSNILTLEEKKYLQRVCRYLGSLGMTNGIIEFEFDYSEFDCEDVDWKQITTFSNNYTAEIPDVMIEISKKLLNYVCENDLIRTPDVDDVNWQRIEIDLDCEDSTISVVLDYNYYDTGDTETDTRSLEEEEENESLREVFDVLEDDPDIQDRILTIDYSGGGDSGYLEDSFNNGDSVPASVSDFCYDMLENRFGGWEINEGSQGNFEIDLDRKEITLNHTYNIDETGRDTLLEEKF